MASAAITTSLRAMAILLGGALLAGNLGADEPKNDTTKAINETLAASWKTHNLQPSDKTTDQEFIRRATLDIIGRIATVDEVRTFQKDSSDDKRARLVDRLLGSDEYATYWSRVWTVWLLGRSVRPAQRDQLEQWLQEQFAKNQGFDKIAVGLIAARGKSAENGAVQFLLANLGEPLPKNKWTEEGQFDMVQLTGRTLRLFLGYRLQYNPQHPLHADFELKHFWGINTFFRQVERRGDDGSEIIDNEKLNPENYAAYENREGLTYSARARFLDGRVFDEKLRTSRRQQLADFIVKDDNFSKAFVNRMWGQFFGRGLNEQPSIDDFGSHNKVAHPQLLARLASDFAAGGHDPKKLIRAVCTCDAYQLTSVSNPTNSKREAQPYFSRMALKIMNPEQLFESLLVATNARPGLDKDAYKKLKEECLGPFVTHPGNYESDELALGDNLLPAMAMINNKAINDAILDKDGTVARAIAKAKGDPEPLIEDLYLAALNRSPNAKESERIQRIINDTKPKAEDKNLTPLWQDLLWALINSNEFILNH